MTDGEAMRTDREIGERVVCELEWDARIGQNTIEIEVDRGVVVLRGSIGSWAERQAAEEAAQRVGGVREVSNRLEVKLTHDAQRSDVELAKAAQNVLDEDVFIPQGKIVASANCGQVILQGQVTLCSQRDDAERVVRNIRGVRRVLNRVLVSPTLGEAHQVQQSLEAALVRRDEVEARRINVAVHDGKVILSGVVHSWSDRQLLVGAAKGTRGVRSVDDRLLVEPYANASR